MRGDRGTEIYYVLMQINYKYNSLMNAWVFSVYFTAVRTFPQSFSVKVAHGVGLPRRVSDFLNECLSGTHAEGAGQWEN